MTDKTGNGQHGAFFTPDDVADAMAAMIPESALSGDILDPTCGSGNLLEAVVRRRLALGHDPAAISEGIHGFDIQPHYVEMCRARLQALCPGQPFPHIVNADFLEK